MDRITIKDLRAVCDRLNRLTGSPAEPYSRGADGKLHANIGNHSIGQAYGGFSLERMHNEGGGITMPLGLGHIPARDLYERMHAYIRGFEAALEAQREAA